jgi:hypothetical protein
VDLLSGARRYPVIAALVCDCTEIEARLAEITENLHRVDLTPEEASLQRAEYARLTAVKRGASYPPKKVWPSWPHIPPAGGYAAIPQEKFETILTERRELDAICPQVCT